jgi:pyruvate dehydrogenase E2 component (dihydrolipoamide acetyltransferase)
MEGSTFTVSNLGMFGIVEFNSIINQLILQSYL